MFRSVRITLHRWFDMTKASKPVGWFWLPLDNVLNVIINMHAFYVSDEVILLEAGKTANVRRDPQSVCAFPPWLEQILTTVSFTEDLASSTINLSLFLV
jgi:hypothetical protein